MPSPLSEVNRMVGEGALSFAKIKKIKEDCFYTPLKHKEPYAPYIETALRRTKTGDREIITKLFYAEKKKSGAIGAAPVKFDKSFPNNTGNPAVKSMHEAMVSNRGNGGTLVKAVASARIWFMLKSGTSAECGLKLDLASITVAVSRNKKNDEVPNIDLSDWDVFIDEIPDEAADDEAADADEAAEAAGDSSAAESEGGGEEFSDFED